MKDTNKSGTVDPPPELVARAQRENELFGDYHAKIRPFVEELAARGNVTAAEWAVPMNTYERSRLVTRLELSVLLEHAEYCRSQCNPVRWIVPIHPTTYDEALAIEIMPELIRRLKALGPLGFAVEVCDDHDGGSVWIIEEEFLETREEAEELAAKLSLRRDNGLARVTEVYRQPSAEYRHGKRRDEP